MKENLLSMLFVFTCLTPAYADLGNEAAKNCKDDAIQHAIEAEKGSWGSEVSVLHLDRAISTGVLQGSNRYDSAGTANVEVTLSRESADPVVYEMALTGKPQRGAKQMKCEITKTDRRDLLQ